MWWIALLFLFVLFPIPVIVIGMIVFIFKIFSKTIGNAK